MASPNRIDVALKAAKDAGKVAYIPYITSGFPTKEDTVPMLLGMQEAGADIIEVRVAYAVGPASARGVVCRTCRLASACVGLRWHCLVAGACWARE